MFEIKFGVFEKTGQMNVFWFFEILKWPWVSQMKWKFMKRIDGQLFKFSNRLKQDINKKCSVI